MIKYVILFIVFLQLFSNAQENRWVLYDSSNSCKQYYDLGTLEYNDGNVTILIKTDCDENLFYSSYNKYASYFIEKRKIFCKDKKIVLIELKAYWMDGTIDLFPTGEQSFYNIVGSEEYLYNNFCK